MSEIIAESQFVSMDCLEAKKARPPADFHNDRPLYGMADMTLTQR
jgi:hypothetical protein